MENIEEVQGESEECLEFLENTDIVLSDLDEKKLLSTAMSSYYLLYR